MCKYCEEINGKINGKNIMESIIQYTDHKECKLVDLPIRVNLHSTKWFFDNDYSNTLCIEVLREDHNKEYITIFNNCKKINFCPMCGRKLNKESES